MGKTIGIDLGTTNSAMAVLEGGEPTIITNSEGNRTTPSVVGFSKNGERLVGTVAKRQAVTNPQNTVFSIKRFMGRKYADVSEEMKIVPYEVAQGSGAGVFEVKSTSGDNHLGGDNFDKAVVDWLIAEFKKQKGVDLSKDRSALQRLYESAEKAKVELSSTMETTINQPFISMDDSGPLHLEIGLTRAKLEELTADLLNRVVGPTKTSMKDAGFKAGDLDQVILVGGMTRMPAVAEKVRDLTGKQPHKGINPDEVVAMGAAIQAGVLSGDVKDVLLLDVTPLSLGIETKGGVFTRLLDRNTTIPTRKGETFSTAEDNQTSVEIHVLQGEREMAMYNQTLGKFQLTGIPPAPRGIPQIEVTFDIDANGIVHVSAKDTATGNEQTIEIKSSSGLSEQEVEQMVKDAESHAGEDRKKKEEVETRNQAENLVYSTRRSLGELGDKVDGSTKSEIEDAAAALEEATKGDDIEAIKTKMQTLQEAAHKLSEAAYEAAQSAQGDGAAGGGASAEGDEEEVVEEAEYEVIDEDQ